MEVAAIEVSLIAGARNHHHRPSVGGGVGEPDQAMDTARARDSEKKVGLAGKIAVGGGSIARRLLAVEGEEANAD